MLYDWKIAFKNAHFRNKFIISLGVMLVILIQFAWLLAYVENRQRHLFYDPILNFIKPRDVSYMIFFITYGVALVGLLYAIVSPYRFLHMIQMYATLTGLRMMTLLFMPLTPQEGIISVQDAFLEHTFYAGSIYLKDLFFSGHAASLFLLYLFTTNKWLKFLFLLAFLAVSVGIIVQNVHYHYDVIAAPIFAYIAYRLITKFSKHYYTQVPKQPEI